MATIERRFPTHLLDQSIEDRLHYFGRLTVAHTKLKCAYYKLMDRIKVPVSPLLLVYGPTGVGKSTLQLQMIKKVLESSLPLIEQNPGIVPIAGVEAVTHDKGLFQWKDYYKRALEALHEPLIDYKIVTKISPLDGSLVTGPARTEAERRMVLENALCQRQTKVFFIDEAQHMLKKSSGRALEDQLDCIKSLANMSSTVHVLVGTYQLLPLYDLSGQLIRRSKPVHLGRYKANNLEDVTQFKNVLATFLAHLPLPEQEDLTDRWDFFYERAVGCVGILKDWMHLSLGEALRKEKSTVSIDMLEKNSIPTKHLKRLAEELIEGEKSAEAFEGGTEKDVSELRTLLDLNDHNSQSVSTTNQKPRSRSQRQKPGVRNPTRDKVGRTHHGANSNVT